MTQSKSKMKNIGLWLVAFILMAAVAVYQRVTGPTQPLKGKITFAGKQISYKFLRSENCGTDAPVLITFDGAKNSSISAELDYKRYKSNDSLTSCRFENVGEDTLLARLPHQPAAGKIVYSVMLADTLSGKSLQVTKTSTTLRYKGEVPDFVLILHIILMFGSMLVAARTVFEALRKSDKTYKYCLWTVIFLLAGGLIMGPIVQHYAFGVYWSGWPLGRDMTDNKTIFSFLIWLIALYQMKTNKESYNWVIVAFVVMMATYLIPHSVFGSELDYTKMPIK